MNGLHTLVVDDSASARALLQRILESQGITVVQSCSAREALEYLKAHKPDLIFMDHNMPGMNGLEALQAIGSNPDTAVIPVVMYTAQNDAEYVREARAKGAVDLVVKPASPERITLILNNLFEAQHNTQQQLSKQINHRFDQLQRSLENLIDQRFSQLHQHVEKQIKNSLACASTAEAHSKRHSTRELLPLIHSIADAKIHRLNIEIRNHLSARLDVVDQDLRMYSTPSPTAATSASLNAQHACADSVNSAVKRTTQLRSQRLQLLFASTFIAAISYFIL